MISLRDLEEVDRDRLFVWRNQHNVRRWMYNDHVIERTEHDRWFDSVLVDTSKKYWVIVLDGQPIGVVNLVGLEPTSSAPSFGIYVAEPSATRTGAGGAALRLALNFAFEHDHVTHVEAEVLEGNAAAISLYARIGMRAKGRVSGSGRRAGALRWSISRDEWTRNTPSVGRHVAIEKVQT